MANTLTVSKKKPENSEKREIIIRNISLAYDSMTEEKLYARSRYRAPLIEITFQKNKDNTVTIFPKDEGLVASSGQSLVIYQGDICLGGGVIV